MTQKGTYLLKCILQLGARTKGWKVGLFKPQSLFLFSLLCFSKHLAIYFKPWSWKQSWMVRKDIEDIRLAQVCY